MDCFKQMRKRFLWLSFIFSGLMLTAQPTDGLVGYYSFDACDATEESGQATDGIIIGNAQCGCGVSGNGLLFDGNTSVQILSNIDLIFASDFTISFFILPDPQSNSIMDILSKSEVCGIDSTMELKYNPVNRAMSLSLSQQSNLSARASYDLPDDRCYHHIVYVRNGRELIMYYDGVQVDLAASSTIVRIINNGILTLGAGPCLANGEVMFRGTLDELRFYNRALNTQEVRQLYLPVDRVASPDTVLFTGTSMQVRLPITCAPNIQWTPSSGVSNAMIAEPQLSPTVSTTYEVHMNYGFCEAFDSLRVTLADSSDLICDKIYFPSGFTPNEDGLNDTWGMSNVVFLGEFIELEVFDRWGGSVFYTTDQMQEWDGTLDGEKILPGQYVYMLTYKCEGKERRISGSFVMIR